MQLTSRRRSFQNLSGFQLQYHHHDLQRKAPHVVNGRMQQRSTDQLIDFDIKSYYESTRPETRALGDCKNQHFASPSEFTDQNSPNSPSHQERHSKIESQILKELLEVFILLILDLQSSSQLSYHFDTAKLWTAGGVGLNEFCICWETVENYFQFVNKEL